MYFTVMHLDVEIFLSYLRYHGLAKFEDLCLLILFRGFSGGSVVKNLLANAGTVALIPGP